ncbi:hypothetical protein HNY73_002875 [Argiope bruennichi]|uniref:Gustatory receptor n=1 Tax=Argiope bruennichi TaxID=94029 RepID=A0A8T0FXR2_ARGBR|nr:hypothetical protein HNY73_002875 [Argiope bruennichi]
MCRYISLYIAITQAVKDIDEALGTSAFFLFVTVICSLFNSVSVVLAKSESYRTPVVDAYVVWSTLTALVTFLLLTFSGAQVQKGHDNIKQAVTDCSDLVVQLSPNLKTTLTFTLLVENIKGSDIVVTGWDMFTIRKGFILSVAGLMMTYGVLMYQMDALKTDHETRMVFQDFFGKIHYHDLQRLLVYTNSISYVFTHTYSLLTMMFFSLLSYHTFIILSDSVEEYRKSLKDLIYSGCDDLKSVQKHLTYFRRIIECIQVVEAGFSWITLLLLISNISTFFLMLSAIADGWANYLQVMVLMNIIGSFTASAFEFLAVATTGIKLSKADDALKRLAICFAEKSFQTRRSGTEEKISLLKLHYFSVLASTLRRNALELTGGKMFILKESLITSVIGCMLTYGVLIFQFRN